MLQEIHVLDNSLQQKEASLVHKSSAGPSAKGSEQYPLPPELVAVLNDPEPQTDPWPSRSLVFKAL